MATTVKNLTATKVLVGPVRLSYTHLVKRYQAPGTESEGKFMTNLLISKKDKEAIDKLNSAIEAAVQVGIGRTWGGKRPKKLMLPLNDGDEKEDELYEKHYYLNAKSKYRPQVINKDREPLEDEEEIYSGMWAYLTIDFYPYSISGNNGVAVSLGNVLKYKDDDRLGGSRASAETDFASLDFEDDDDDDL